MRPFRFKITSNDLLFRFIPGGFLSIFIFILFFPKMNSREDFYLPEPRERDFSHLTRVCSISCWATQMKRINPLGTVGKASTEEESMASQLWQHQRRGGPGPLCLLFAIFPPFIRDRQGIPPSCPRIISFMKGMRRGGRREKDLFFKDPTASLVYRNVFTRSWTFQESELCLTLFFYQTTYSSRVGFFLNSFNLFFFP